MSPRANKYALHLDTDDTRRRTVRDDTPLDPSIRTTVRSPPGLCTRMNANTSALVALVGVLSTNA